MPKKQADGRYRAKIVIGSTAEGKPITKYVSATTTRELEEAKSAARSHYIDGAELTKDRLFSEYVVEWYEAVRKPKISTSSRQSYRAAINNDVLPAFGGRMLRAIRPLEIQTWLNGYAGMSMTKLTVLLAIMRGVYSSALAEGIVQRDPTTTVVKPEPSKPKEKRAFTSEEKARIEITLARHRHGLFLSVLYHLGVRLGEALGLKWGDIDWAKRTVHVQRDIDYKASHGGTSGELKTQNADRLIPIPDTLYDALTVARGLPGVFIFHHSGAPWSRTMFQRAWMELMIDTGFAVERMRPPDALTDKVPHPDIRLDWETEITPHYFRHNYATMLYDAGVDPLVAMRLLGHADYATTAKIYTHLNSMHVEKASESINAAFSSKKVAAKLPRR